MIKEKEKDKDILDDLYNILDCMFYEWHDEIKNRERD